MTITEPIFLGPIDNPADYYVHPMGEPDSCLGTPTAELLDAATLQGHPCLYALRDDYGRLDYVEPDRVAELRRAGVTVLMVEVALDA